MRITAAIILIAGAVTLSIGLAHAAAGSTDIQSRYTNAYRQCPGSRPPSCPKC